MFVATTVVTLLLAAALAASAARKRTHRADVVRTYTRVGVPEDRLDALAAVLLAGAAGLLLGLVWAPIGIAAGIGVVCYFALAVGAHIRAGDLANVQMPAALLVMSAAALVLRLLTR